LNSLPEVMPLKRVVGVGSLGLNVVNLTIAAGIFGLPAIIAAILGAQAILAYLVCAMLFGLVGLCLAEAGSRVGSAGGLYAYASAPFGPIVGGVAGTVLWVTTGAAADAAIINLLVDTLSAVLPGIGAPWVRVAIILTLFTVVAIVNVRGVTYGLRLSAVLTVIKIAPLALLVIGGAFFIDPAKFVWPGLPSLHNIAQASIILFFAFIGVESALSMSGEVIRPSRTIPRGILMGLLIIAGLYMGLQLVAQGTLGAALAQSKAPLVDASKVVFGSWGSGLIVVAVAISACGCIAADVLSTPRVLHAFAQQGQLPRQVAAIHPRFGTPAVAIGVYSAVCAALALSGTFRQLGTLASSGTLLVYLVCCLGVLRLRAKNVVSDEAPFRVPFGPLIPLAACAIILWMLSTLTRLELGAALGFVVVVGLAYTGHELRRHAPRPDPPDAR
jgi:basic amino acid/polyamine antiporter, APA family